MLQHLTSIDQIPDSTALGRDRATRGKDIPDVLSEFYVCL